MTEERRADGWLPQADHDSIRADVAEGLRCAKCHMAFTPKYDGPVATVEGYMHGRCATQAGLLDPAATSKPAVRFTKQDMFG